MSDLIDRQQAIEAVQNRHMMLSKEKVLLINDIEKLPSAQPTFDARDTQYNLPIGTDCISRQSAVDELVKMLSDCFYADEEVLDAVETTLKELPSAQPELPEECERCMMEHTDEMEKLEAELAMAQPKRGKWIDRGEHGDWEWQADGRGKHWHEWECNICHHYFDERTFFCPHCGADMREVTT